MDIYKIIGGVAIGLVIMLLRNKIATWIFAKKSPLGGSVDPNDVEGNLEKLRASGHITQEQYDSAIKGLKASKEAQEKEVAQSESNNQ